MLILRLGGRRAVGGQIELIGVDVPRRIREGKPRVIDKMFDHAIPREGIKPPDDVKSTHYLGRPEDIIARCSAEPSAPKPSEAMVREFGAVMALYDLAQRLTLIEHLDRHVPKRGAGRKAAKKTARTRSVTPTDCPGCTPHVTTGVSSPARISTSLLV